MSISAQKNAREKRTNETHQSTTDPEALLYRKSKGQASRLYFMGNRIIDNREGIIVAKQVTQATGLAECEASEAMLKNLRKRKRVGKKRITVGADKGYDRKEHVKALRRERVTPHISPKASHGSGLIDLATASVRRSVSALKKP